jgi:hypothetical protein
MNEAIQADDGFDLDQTQLDGLLAQAGGDFDEIGSGQLAGPIGGGMIPAGGVLRAGGQYATAVQGLTARKPKRLYHQLLAEAEIAAEEFFYGWGAGKDRVIGPSIGLAQAAARLWGNCAVEPAPLQETQDAWIFSVSFIDLETGFTIGRQFRQSKKWTVFGKFDAERKDDIRFQIGQSKAARNVIINALPRWMISGAIKAAQSGSRKRIEGYIERNGIAAAQDYAIKMLGQHGVPEAAILDKCGVAEAKALSLDDLVMLKGDLHALQAGQDRADALFPAMSHPETKGKAEADDLNAKLDAEEAKRREHSEATKAGMEEAKKQGKQVGRPKGKGKAKGEAEKPDEQPGEKGDAEEAEAVNLPKGAAEAIEKARNPAQVDKLFKKYEPACPNVETWEQLSALCEGRKESIRKLAPDKTNGQAELPLEDSDGKDEKTGGKEV